MPAHEHLNPQLFHGTLKPFPKRTRKVWPTPSDGGAGGYEKGWRIAHATSNIDEARLYGPVVYEVKYDEHTYPGYSETTYFSEKGFNIIKRVE
ncbi:hypothetical protein EB001_15390 [bacterium]|nr:hypothetical protein [bacterium]